MCAGVYQPRTPEPLFLLLVVTFLRVGEGKHPVCARRGQLVDER